MNKVKRRVQRGLSARTPAGTPVETASTLFDQAVRYHQAGQASEAEALYRRIVRLQPTHAESRSNLGLALIGRGAFAEAVAVLRQALLIAPHYAAAQSNLIVALEAAGRIEEAVPVYRSAIALEPDRAALQAGLGRACEAIGDWAGAEEARRRWCDLVPGDPRAHFDLGRSLASLSRTEEAIAAYRAALAIAPDLVEALSNLGALLALLGRFGEASEVGGRAIALLPDNAEILNNHAVGLQRQGQAAEAADLYRRAVAIDPGYASAWANLGVALQEQFKFDDAVEAFEKAIAVKPDFHSAIVELIKLRRHVCDWSQYDVDHRRLIELLGQETDAVFMLVLMTFPSTPQQQLACARRHMRRLNGIAARIGDHARASGNGRLRVGYLSADYRDHPVGRLLPELFAQHDRKVVDVVAYALGRDDPGRVRRRIARACDRFVDLHGLSDRDAAARIHADGIDVLVDLTGPTTGARLDVLNLRPAPVQVSFLGWPGTTGADCIDYVVGDPFLTSAEHEAFYSEKIVQLPHSYQPSDPYRATALPILDRSGCGLPDDAFVFCSFNNTVKLTPDMFDLWLRLLSKVEGSVLWLYCKTPKTMANLKARADARGISPDRIVFAPVATMEVYLARMRLADLFLDSYPYNAGATCNDALWMGLPVITCAGDTYVSRMAASLLRAAALPGLITGSLEAYEALALRLATEPPLLGAVKARLAGLRDGSPLFDMPRFATAWESALLHMHARFRAGHPPTGFAVGDAPT